jgi:hypothetical protein
MRKTSLFEFEVPVYKKRAAALPTADKQSR